MTRPIFSILALGILSACGAKHAATFDIGEATAEVHGVWWWWQHGARRGG